SNDWPGGADECRGVHTRRAVVRCLLRGAISRKTAMGADIKLAFDILAFTSVMVLIVLGLGVIASMMGIFNFAHGEFVLLGAYTLYLFHERALPLWLGIIA